jgi:hypothetical protein
MTSFADATRDWFTRGGGTGKTVVFSCYFSKKIDPQRGGYLLSNKYAHPHLAQAAISCFKARADSRGTLAASSTWRRGTIASRSSASPRWSSTTA